MERAKPQQQAPGISSISNSAYSSSASKIRRIKCLYTKQLTKKRKTWSDGLLKISCSGGSYYCSLSDAANIRESVLVSRPLENIEVQKLKKNEEVELEFENYLVNVLSSSDSVKDTGPPLKLAKFVPPSRYIPPTTNSQSYVNNAAPVVASTSSTAFGGGRYRVSPDELDDIWDTDAPTKNTKQQNVCDNSMRPSTQDASKSVQYNGSLVPPHQTQRGVLSAAPAAAMAPRWSSQALQRPQLGTNDPVRYPPSATVSFAGSEDQGPPPTRGLATSGRHGLSDYEEPHSKKQPDPRTGGMYRYLTQSGNSGPGNEPRGLPPSNQFPSATATATVTAAAAATASRQDLGDSACHARNSAGAPPSYCSSIPHSSSHRGTACKYAA
jgi:hypothetical protein